MVVAIAVGFQSHRAQQVARLDSAPRAVSILMFENPVFGVAERAGAERFRAMAIVKSETTIGDVEDAAQREPFCAARLFEFCEMGRLDVQLEDAALVVDFFLGPRRLQQHQAHQGSARP